jgi:tetratricopeptide (TPR) repeat protein
MIRIPLSLRSAEKQISTGRTHEPLNQQPLDKHSSINEAIKALKAKRPLRAEEICRDYLAMHPGCADHIRLLAHALQKQGRLGEAEKQLRFAISIRPNFPQLYEDLGSVLAMQKRFDEAIPSFEQAIQLDPTQALAHKKLGQALAIVGRGEDADEAFEEYFDKRPDDREIAAGATHLKEGRVDEAMEVFREVIRKHPNNVNAMRYLAVAYWTEKQKLDDAEALLRRVVEIAPDFAIAWMNLAMVQLERLRYLESIDSYLEATRLEPKNPAAWGGLGNAYARANYQEKSAEAFARAVELNPDAHNLHMGYAHVLKTLGDQKGALKAYRAAIAAKPDFGEVYWSMANLKIFNFEENEVQAMEHELEHEELSESADVHFRFALGKAYEDKKDYERAWHYYHTGNQKQRTQVKHDPLEMELRQNEIIEVFTREFIEEHTGKGFEAPDPILVVGLPRTGSTLVEQILASHSQVEGTSELPNLGRIANSIGRYRSDKVHFPLSARELRNKDWRAYGKQYIDETRRHRETERPFFIDKLPNNYALVGLLHLILPNAKVINTRRHPYDSCLGAYKQLFGRGQNFTYDMYDLADYYRQYIQTMKHWHEVLPGKVLDVHYEETVTDLEGQVRRILDHCGLPFEEQCLRYWETERAVRTASSEQVRQPIYTGALGKWRRYEKHLDLWKEQLGDIVAELPEVVRRAGV